VPVLVSVRQPPFCWLTGQALPLLSQPLLTKWRQPSPDHAQWRQSDQHCCRYRSAEQIQKAVRRVIDQWGRLDIVLVNAGIQRRMGTIENFTCRLVPGNHYELDGHLLTIRVRDTTPENRAAV